MERKRYNKKSWKQNIMKEEQYSTMDLQKGGCPS